VASNQPVSLEVARRYSRRGAEPVRVDIQDLQRLGVRCLLDNLLEEHGVVRHDAARLSQLLIEELSSAVPPPAKSHPSRAENCYFILIPFLAPCAVWFVYWPRMARQPNYFLGRWSRVNAWDFLAGCQCQPCWFKRSVFHGHACCAQRIQHLRICRRAL